jgi:hypothetical protein
VQASIEDATESQPALIELPCESPSFDEGLGDDANSLPCSPFRTIDSEYSELAGPAEVIVSQLPSVKKERKAGKRQHHAAAYVYPYKRTTYQGEHAPFMRPRQTHSK